MRATTVKFLIFAVTMTLIFAGLAVVFSQARFTGTENYRATFTDVSGLGAGDKVRIAGVQVGSVKTVDIGRDNTAEIEFDVDAKHTLFTGTRATVRYENLVGDRYLELLEGAGSVDVLPAGGNIPIEQTEPALDLDLLLGGFKPLLQGLDAQQVNDLSGALLQVFQGQGDTLVSLLGNTNSFTNSLADRDQLIATSSTTSTPSSARSTITTASSRTRSNSCTPWWAGCPPIVIPSARRSRRSPPAPRISPRCCRTTGPTCRRSSPRRTAP